MKISTLPQMSKIIIVCVILFAIFIFTYFVNNSNQDEHNDLDKDIENLKNNVSLINGTLTSLDTNVRVIDTTVNVLDSNFDLISNNVGLINDNVNDIENVVDQIDINVNTNTTEISNLSTNVNTNTTDISNISANVSGHINLISTNITDISNLNSTLSGHTTDISNLNSNVNTNTTDISNISTNVSGHTKDISNLNTLFNTNATDISNINANIINNDTDITSLQSSLNYHRSIYNYYEGIAAIERTLDVSGDIYSNGIFVGGFDVKNGIDVNMADISNLNDTLSGHTTDISNLNDTLSGYTTDISNLNSTLLGHASAINTNATNISNVDIKADNNNSLIGVVSNNLTTAINTNTTNISNVDIKADNNNSLIGVVSNNLTTNISDLENKTVNISNRTDGITINGGEFYEVKGGAYNRLHLSTNGNTYYDASGDMIFRPDGGGSERLTLRDSGVIVNGFLSAQDIQTTTINNTLFSDLLLKSSITKGTFVPQVQNINSGLSNPGGTFKYVKIYNTIQCWTTITVTNTTTAGLKGWDYFYFLSTIDNELYSSIQVINVGTNKVVTDNATLIHNSGYNSSRFRFNFSPVNNYFTFKITYVYESPV